MTIIRLLILLAVLAGGHARVGVVEGFDDADAALQAGDPVAPVEAGGCRVDVVGVLFGGGGAASARRGGHGGGGVSA